MRYSNLNLIAQKNADPLKATIDVKGGVNTPNDGLVRVDPYGAGIVTTKREVGQEQLPGQVTVENANGLGSSFTNHGITSINGSTVLKIWLKANALGVASFDQSAKAANNLPQFEPLTQLETGSQVLCTGDSSAFTITDGRFEIPRRMDGQNPSSDQQATITAETVKLDIGTSLSMPGPRYNWLRVEGKLKAYGEIKLALARNSTEDACDRIIVTGEVRIDEATTKLTLRWGDLGEALTHGRRAWLLMQSENDTFNAKPDDARTTVPNDLTINTALQNQDKRLVAEAVIQD